MVSAPKKAGISRLAPSSSADIHHSRSSRLPLSPLAAAMFLAGFFLVALVSAICAAASPIASRTATATAPSLGNWYHDSSHPAHALFRRRRRRDDDDSPSVGSAEWKAQYPSSTPSTSDLPQEWIDALNDAVSDGRIPNIPPSSSSGGSAPVYPAGTQENRDTSSVCAWTDRVCRIPGLVYDAPEGYMGIGFDDGPTEFSPMLYDFLQNNSIRSTHYMIGINILQHSDEFLMCYNGGSCDIAVHTWTHPMMTTLSNLDVLAQFAWTIQIIYDSTDGKIPRFWRPPSGDIDLRVHAIAQEVFGLTAILWNQDTEDWTLAETPPGTNLATIQSQMVQWLGGPKSPGLIILEHELTNNTIQAFITAYPLIAQNGWKTASQALLASNDSDAYSDDDDDSDSSDDSDSDSDEDSDYDDIYQDSPDDDPAFSSLLTSATSTTVSPSGTLGSEQSSSTPSSPASGKASGGEISAHFAHSALVVSGFFVGILPLLL